jgi:aspartyl-tRNA(Asn)/glutamyl-tRNA(Gln) amidotransferase subunit A
MLAAMVGGARGERLVRESRASVKRLRVGVSRYHLRDVDPAIASAIERALAVLRPLVRDVREVRLAGLDDAHSASGVVAGAEAYAFHERTLLASPAGYGPIVRQRLEGGAKHSAVAYIRAYDHLRVAQSAFEEAFSQVDVLVGASIPCTPPTIASQTGVEAVARTVHELSRLNAAQNMAGVPALVVPCGCHDGLPVGMQLIGGRGRDGTLLALGAAYQRTTDWHARRPKA